MTKTINKVKAETPSGKPTTIRGYTSLSGVRWLKISYDRNSAYVPLSSFVMEKNEARRLLMEHGIPITSDRDWRAIMSAIDDVPSFPERRLLDRPGWTSPYYAEANGYVHAPKSCRRGRAIFTPATAGGRATSGSHSEWLSQVAQPLTGQDLPIFFVLLAFASAVIRFQEHHNFGFELWGPPARGKTTLLTLCASVAGDPDGIPTFNATPAWLDKLFPLMHDRPFPIDEVNLLPQVDRHGLVNFAFRMANGVVKLTAFANDAAQYRFIYATSSNRPFQELTGSYGSDTSSAALQRLMPLRVPSTELGVFNFVPDGFSGSGAFATYLAKAMRAQFGTPYRTFLDHLVQARHTDAAQFDRMIADRVAHFGRVVGVAASSAGQTRASNAIGLIYAVSDFAVARGVIPQEWDCLAACAAVYRNYQSQIPDQTPLTSRLATILSQDDIRDLRGQDAGAKPSADKPKRHTCFIVDGKKSRVELLLPTSARIKWFPDWKHLRHCNDFQQLIVGKGPRFEVQRRLMTQGKREWYTAFALPPSIISQCPWS